MADEQKMQSFDVLKPIDMILFCPACGLQHVDQKETDVRGGDLCVDWDNPPHRSHLCGGCGYIWRPADVCTNGVQEIQTKGKADHPVIRRLASSAK